MLLMETEPKTATKEIVPLKTLEQLEYYKLHYQQIYFKAKLRVKPVLLKHLRKLSAQIGEIQGNLSTIC